MEPIQPETSEFPMVEGPLRVQGLPCLHTVTVGTTQTSRERTVRGGGPRHLGAEVPSPEAPQGQSNAQPDLRLVRHPPPP